MKARFENGVIVLYEQLPETYKNDEVNIVGGFDLLSKQELEELGFFDVIEPELKVFERYGSVQWDNILNSFVYEVRISPPPPLIKILTKYQFISRLTFEERLAIYTAESESVVVRMWLDTFRICEEIDLTNAETIAGVQMLETLGLIAIGRASEILTPKTE